MAPSFDPARDIPDLHGKTVIVTGGNAGLGAATVRAVAAHNPSQLILCARTPSKAEAFIAEVKKEHPDTNVVPVQMDLASFDNIKKGAAEISKSTDRIDVLFLNAGISGLAPAMTPEGYELTFGTNHMGHALLTQLLMPKIIKATKEPNSDVRIVVVSSIGAHRFQLPGGLDLDAVKTDMASIGPLIRYGQSKLANIYFAQRLSKEYPSIISTAPHPGTVMTEIWDKATGAPWWLKLVWPLIWATGVSIDEGAKNQLWCAFGEGVQNGKYYEPVGKLKSRSNFGQSEKLQDELWNWTNAELAKHGGPGWPNA